MIQADTIISGGTILLLDEKDSIVKDGAIAVKGGMIAAVGSRAEIEGKYQAPEIIPAQGSLVMPGLINGHTHAAMTCFRGIADDLPLLQWLNDFIFPAEAKNLGPELVYWGTMLACAEMIRSGTTTFTDMYLFEDEAAQAAKEAGMRCLLGEGLFDFPSPNAKTPAEGLQYTERMLKKWSADPLVNIFVVPHSLYTCSPPLLRSASQLAREYGVPLATHLLENQEERAIIRNKHGQDAIPLLRELGLLESRFIAFHGVLLDDADIRVFSEHDARVIHHPESNMKLACGIAPIPELLKAGIPVGLGTDGCASNNNLDLFGEMDMAAKLHKVARLDPTVMDSRTVLRMATCEGARALGFDDTGVIAPGMRADIILIGLNKPHLTPLYNEYSHLVYTVGGADVDTVMVEGKLLMKDRVLLTINENEVMARVNEFARGIKASLAG
ncbi:MAG: amidohydrolase [Smithellaceae bacterium]|nr:amidohydrolase [Smithellaceae bacterium]